MKKERGLRRKRNPKEVMKRIVRPFAKDVRGKMEARHASGSQNLKNLKSLGQRARMGEFRIKRKGGWGREA